MKYLIDTPSPFASTTRWQEFLDEMRKLPQDDPQVSEAIEVAEKALRNPGERK